MQSLLQYAAMQNKYTNLGILSISQINTPDKTYSREAFQEQVVHCIVGNRLPFRLIENVQFRRLLNLAAGPNKKLHFPNRNGVKDLLMQLAHTSRRNIMGTLPSDSKISIALDCWTSPDQKPFMAVIGYFISADFRFCEALLGFSPLEGSHSGDRLGSVLLKILRKHDLSHRLLGITTDNVRHNIHILSPWLEHKKLRSY